MSTTHTKVLTLSVEGVLPASVLCQPQASFRDIGQNSAGLLIVGGLDVPRRTIFGAPKCLQTGRALASKPLEKPVRVGRACESLGSDLEGLQATRAIWRACKPLGAIWRAWEPLGSDFTVCEWPGSDFGGL